MISPNLRRLLAPALAGASLCLGGCDDSGPEWELYVEYHMTSGACPLLGDRMLPYSMVTYENITFWAQVLGADGTPYADQGLAYAFDSQGELLPQYASVAPRRFDSPDLDQLDQELNVGSTLFKLALVTDSQGMLTASRTAQKITLTEGIENGSSSSSSSADGLGAFFTLGIIGIGGVGVDGENSSSYSSGFQVFSYQDSIPFWLPPEQFSGKIVVPTPEGLREIAPVQSTMEIGISEAYVRPVRFIGEHRSENLKTAHINLRETDVLELDGRALEQPEEFCRKDFDDSHRFFDDADNEVDCVEFVEKAKSRVNCMSNHTALITETFVVAEPAVE